jgi:hypothetical protein
VSSVYAQGLSTFQRPKRGRSEIPTNSRPRWHRIAPQRPTWSTLLPRGTKHVGVDMITSQALDRMTDVTKRDLIQLNRISRIPPCCAITRSTHQAPTVGLSHLSSLLTRLPIMALQRLIVSARLATMLFELAEAAVPSKAVQTQSVLLPLVSVGLVVN